MNESDDRRWLEAGRGLPPERDWSFTTDAPLAGFDLAREAGDVAAADTSGGVCLIDRQGQVVALNRGFDGIEEIAWSDDGRLGAAVLAETTLCLLNRQLRVEWTQKFWKPILTIAMAPYGQHVAVCLSSGENRVLDATRKTVAEFETIRPLNFLQFVATEPEMIGAAEYGLLCRYHVDGRAAWSESLWSNTGGISVTGDGRMIFLPSFSYGVQCFDAAGEQRGTYVVEGSPNLIAASVTANRLAVATVERHLYWLDADGEILWAAITPEDVVQLRCDPLGKGLVCGFCSGRVLRLVWGMPEER